jgi:hypothetical protein
LRAAASAHFFYVSVLTRFERGLMISPAEVDRSGNAFVPFPLRKAAPHSSRRVAVQEK